MKKLLRRPAPYESESLLSYLIRLSMENSVPSDWIRNIFGLKKTKYINKINTISDNERLEKVVDLTSLSYDEVKNMTISWYPSTDSVIYQDLNSRGYFIIA